MTFRSTATPETLIRRAGFLHRIRHFFDENGMIEVQTPVLSHDTVIDRYLQPVPVSIDTGHGIETLYLQTSPEFAMKRLLASGLNAIYQITPVFRQGDRGTFHNVEFSMLEWYRTGDSYSQGIDFLSHLVSYMAQIENCDSIRLEEVLQTTCGLNFDSEPGDYLDAARRLGLVWPESFLDPERPADRNDWFDWLFSEVIQPNLGRTNPVILYDYPCWQSQLAQVREDRDVLGSIHPIAERFELFWHGIELANGYHELCDAAILRDRNEVISRERQRDGSPALPRNSRLLDAMDAGLPPACGCALGLDRLFLIMEHAEKIDDVISFPVERC